MKSLLRAWQFFRADAFLAGGAILLIAVSSFVGLLKPWPIAVLVDSILGDSKLPTWVVGLADGISKPGQVVLAALALVIIHLGHALVGTVAQLVSIQTGLQGLRRVRQAVFSRLLDLSLRYHQSSLRGDIVYRATWDTYAFQTLFQQGVITSCSAGFALLMMVGVMWRLNPGLTWVSLAVVPCLVVCIQGFGKVMRVRGAEAQKTDGLLASAVQQCLEALPVLQSFVRQKEERDRFAVAAVDAQNRRIAQHRSELVYGLAVTMVFAAGTGGIAWYGGHQVLQGQLSIGELLVFIAYLSQLYDPLNQLSHVGATLSSAGVGVNRIFEILDTPEEVSEPKSPRAVRWKGETGEEPASVRLEGSISLERVTFGYDSQRPVLLDLNLRIPAGQAVAVVGASGAGKTTLLHLLPRFFDPNEGVIRLDGVDLREFRLCDLRRAVSFVQQEPLLVPGTLLENITLGKPSASSEEVASAAEAAGALGFIRALPSGFQTVVGEGGARLSVGERQRIGLARAFLKDAPVLLLDEPTSALDPLTERLVFGSLRSRFASRTIILVTHRLHTVRSFDRVVVLDGGKVVEDGAPLELLENSQSCLRRLQGHEPQTPGT